MKGLKEVINNVHESDKFDYVTGLLNGKSFHESLARALVYNIGFGERIAVFSIELEGNMDAPGFSGHESRAKCIDIAGKRLAACTREDDILARLGGNEFALCIENVFLLHNVVKIAEKIVNELSKPYSVGGHNLFLKANIGISIYPTDGITAHQLLGNAKVAMRTAREIGGNTYRLYNIKIANSYGANPVKAESLISI